MVKITLISSFHIIHGKCNPAELYRIIEQIQPEVIFEELSTKIFEIVYSPFHQPKSLEAITIKEYLRKYPIRNFPVDNYPNIDDLLNESQINWDDYYEYRELWNQKLKRIYEGGYYYLNSEECIEFLSKMEATEEAILAEINNPKLIKEHKKEKSLHNIREYVMLRDIYNIASNYSFDQAIFICGAEHRKGIKEKIKELVTVEKLKINWTFYNGSNL